MEELKALRETPALTVVEDTELPQGSHLWLGNRLLVNQAGKQSELRLSFARPATALVLGVDIMAGAQRGSSKSGRAANESQRVYIVYEPRAEYVRVGIADSPENLTALENHTQFVGGALQTVLADGIADCRAHCRARAHCAAWSLNHTAPPFSCSLKKPGDNWRVNRFRPPVARQSALRQSDSMNHESLPRQDWPSPVRTFHTPSAGSD